MRGKTDKKTEERLLWIDGLRGICCLLIFVHHFLLMFYPATYLGAGAPSHLSSGLDVYMAQSPGAFWINGNFLVCIFCLVSGVSISYSAFRKKQERQILVSAAKRLPRLALPLFFVSLAVWGMMQLSWFSNGDAVEITRSWWVGSYYQTNATLWDAVRTSFYDVWFVGNDTFSTAFWMLKYVFYGSMVTYGLVLVLRRKSGWKWPVYFSVAVLFLYMQSMVATFVCGVLLGYGLEKGVRPRRKKWMAVVLIGMGAFLGGYPTGIQPDNIYSFFSILGPDWSPSFFCHTFGAALLVLGICWLDPAFLKTRALCFLGKISYAVYLIHIPLLFSFATWMFMGIYSLNGAYPLDTFFVFITTALLLILISFVFYTTVEQGCYRVINGRLIIHRIAGQRRKAPTMKEA